MNTTYELWDTESSNLVGSFPTEDAALRIVRQAVNEHGERAMDTVALGRETDTGRLEPVAIGVELVRLAFSSNADGSPDSAVSLSRETTKIA